jgi:hypothetical protein
MSKKINFLLFCTSLTYLGTSNAMEDVKNTLSMFYLRIKHPLITIIETLPPTECNLVCHDYAFLKIIDKIGQLPCLGCDWYEKHNILNKYFSQVTNPKKGDLAVYKNNNNILHSGIVEDDYNIISKWGSYYPYVFLHKKYDVPKEYGKTIEYYRPKKTNDEIYNNIIATKIEHRASSRHNQIDQSDLIRLSALTILIIGLWMYTNQ